MKSIKQLLEQEYLGKTLEYWEFTRDDGTVTATSWKDDFKLMDGMVLIGTYPLNVKLKSFVVKEVVVDGEWENEWYCLSDGKKLNIPID